MNIFDINKEEEYLKNKDNIDLLERNDNGDLALITSDINKIKWLLKYAEKEFKNEVFDSELISFHYNNPEIQKILINSGFPVNRSGDSFNSLIMTKDIEVLRLALDKGLNINNENEMYENALFYEKDPKRIDFLLENGISTNVINQDHETPLFHSNLEVTKKIIDCVDVNIVSIDNRNALFYCNNVEKAKMLVGRNIDVDLIDNFGRPAFFVIKDYETLKFLLPLVEDINYKNYDDNAISYQEDLKIVKLFCDNGVTVTKENIENSKGEKKAFLISYLEKKELSQQVSPKNIPSKSKRI